MTDPWDERAGAYRESETHRQGPDLDLVVELCEPRPGVTALDVATGGGHVARRLREAGCHVVTCDPAPGMKPEVVCHAENLPFADASFDAVVCRAAPHHFSDVADAVRELARVARDRVVVQDTLFSGEAQEEAQRLRDPSHVRALQEDEWTELFAATGLEIERREIYVKRHPFATWLALTGCEGQGADRVRELLADRTENGAWLDRHVILKGRKR
jgi:SAM-dependent methyltransferase